jgi:hypothetical protein
MDKHIDEDPQIHAAKVHAALVFVDTYSVDKCWPWRMLARAEHADVLAEEVKRLREALDALYEAAAGESL